MAKLKRTKRERLQAQRDQGLSNPRSSGRSQQARSPLQELPSSLSHAVISHAQALPQLAPPHDLTFPSVLDQTVATLSTYPTSVIVKFQHQRGAAPVDDYGNVTGFLTFAAYSAIYRLQWFLEDVISGLNNQRPLRAISAARGVMELAATTRRLALDLSASYAAMSTAYQEMQQVLQDETEPFDSERLESHSHAYQNALREAITVLQHHATATRVNWDVMRSQDAAAFNSDLENVSDEVKQKNILTVLKKYSADQALVQKIQLYYALQCDYTHPNRGAHQLVTGWSDLDSNVIAYEFALNPSPEFGWTHAIRAIFTPLTLLLPTLMQDIELLSSSQQMFFEQFVKLLQEESAEKPMTLEDTSPHEGSGTP